MKKILWIGGEQDGFEKAAGNLKKHHIQTDWEKIPDQALARLGGGAYDMVMVSDPLPGMAGRAFVEKLVMQNPMLYCVVSSNMPEKKFHDAYEGLGVLMQLPPFPDEADIERLMARLNKITRLSATVNPANRGEAR